MTGDIVPMGDGKKGGDGIGGSCNKAYRCQLEGSTATLMKGSGEYKTQSAGDWSGSPRRSALHNASVGHRENSRSRKGK